MSIHPVAHEFAGQTVNVKMRTSHPHLEGDEHVAEVEDYWDRLGGVSWMHSDGNPAAMIYGLRVGMDRNQSIPIVDQVVYVKIGPFGHLLHNSEIVGVA
jgi:hypothetical protein